MGRKNQGWLGASSTFLTRGTYSLHSLNDTNRNVDSEVGSANAEARQCYRFDNSKNRSEAVVTRPRKWTRLVRQSDRLKLGQSLTLRRPWSLYHSWWPGREESWIHMGCSQLLWRLTDDINQFRWPHASFGKRPNWPDISDIQRNRIFQEYDRQGSEVRHNCVLERIQTNGSGEGCTDRSAWLRTIRTAYIGYACPAILLHGLSPSYLDVYQHLATDITHSISQHSHACKRTLLPRQISEHSTLQLWFCEPMGRGTIQHVKTWKWGKLQQQNSLSMWIFSPLWIEHDRCGDCRNCLDFSLDFTSIERLHE